MGKRIIFMDSDYSFRHSIASSLNRLGHAVVEVDSVPAELCSLETFAYDLVCIDSHLVSADTFSFIRRIRESCPTISVILLTDSWNENHGSADLEELSVSAIVCKPVTPMMFVEQIRQFLSDSTTIQPIPSTDAAIKILKKQYVSRLPEKLRIITEAIETLKKDLRDEVSMTCVLRETHGIKGMAGSYGLSSLGAVMGRMETEFRQIPNGETSLPDSGWNKIECMMKLASRLAEAAVANAVVKRPTGIVT